MTAEAAQVPVSNWRTPADLLPASFDDAPTPSPITSTTDPTPETPKRVEIADKLLPLLGNISNGGLDMSTVLGLLDQSGQGLGALGKLLPLVAPLLQNGGLGNLFGGKKKPTEDIVDLSTINLD